MNKEKTYLSTGLATCENKSKYVDFKDGKEMQLKRPTLLLHSCCGPCSTSVIETLAADYRITVFYYNPNITDRDEYLKRRENQMLAIDKLNEKLKEFGYEQINFLDGDYEPADFYEAAKGLENEPEGGTRCKQCFILRLNRTAEEAKMGGYDFFTTTLSVSPHKNYPLLSEIGRELAVKYGISFLDQDFKKKDGYLRSINLSKEFGLYRQNYCGCEFSKWFEKEQQKK